jgi:hypothetical protein
VAESTVNTNPGPPQFRTVTWESVRVPTACLPNSSRSGATQIFVPPPTPLRGTSRVGWRTLFTSSTSVPFAASRWVLTYMRSTVAVAPPAITRGTGVPPLWKSGSDPDANRMPVTVTGSVERLRSTATPVTVKSVGTRPKSTTGGSAMSACSSPSPVSVTRRSPQPVQGVTARATRFTPAR